MTTRILVTETLIYYKDVDDNYLNDNDALEVYLEEEDTFEFMDSNYDVEVIKLK